MGDMTLMAFIGAALGPGRAILSVFMGAAIGVGRRSSPSSTRSPSCAAGAPRHRPSSRSATSRLELPLVPFGVFLAPAGVVMLLWGDLLIDRYFLGM